MKLALDIQYKYTISQFNSPDLNQNKVPRLDVVFRQIEIVLKDSTAFVYVTQSEKSSHFTLMT